MNTTRSIYESDDRGTVRVDLPVGAPHRRFEVVVVWQEVEEADGAREGEATREELVWPEGFFERFAGALEDDSTLARPEQPPLDAITPLDVDGNR